MKPDTNLPTPITTEQLQRPEVMAMVQHVRRQLVPAALITGHDEKGNELMFRKYPEGWRDVYRECWVGQSYVDEYVYRNVVTVRFTDDFEMSRAEWLEDGTPLELSIEAIAGKKLAREMITVELHFDKVLKVG